MFLISGARLHLIGGGIYIGQSIKGQVVLDGVDDRRDGHLEGIPHVAEDVPVDVGGHPEQPLVVRQDTEAYAELWAFCEEDGGGTEVLLSPPGPRVPHQEDVTGGVEGEHQEGVELEPAADSICNTQIAKPEWKTFKKLKNWLWLLAPVVNWWYYWKITVLA